MQKPYPVLEVTGHDPESLQNNLSAAVNELRTLAMRLGRHGIMVTRHDFASFTVSLSCDVPYGQTWEQQKPGKTARYIPQHLTVMTRRFTSGTPVIAANATDLEATVGRPPAGARPGTPSPGPCTSTGPAESVTVPSNSSAGRISRPSAGPDPPVADGPGSDGLYEVMIAPAGPSADAS